MIYEIYKHTNKLNGKNYIGASAKGWKTRWSSKYHTNKTLHEDIINSEQEDWEHEILKIVYTKEEADKLEAEYIALYESANPEKGYNRSTSQGHKGCHHTEEAKEMIANGHKGKPNPMTREHRQKISESNKGKHGTPTWLIGCKRKISQEQKTKQSERMKGNQYWKNKKNVTIGVDCFDREGNLICSYPTIKEAAKAVGGTPTKISECLHGKRKTHKKYIWKRRTP